MSVRDVISAEMWEAINSVHLGLARRRDRRDRLRRPLLLRQLRQESRALLGLASRTMLRDDAYAFLDAGGRFESADMVLRMLRVALPPARRAARPRATGRRSRCSPRSAACRRSAAPSCRPDCRRGRELHALHPQLPRLRRRLDRRRPNRARAGRREPARLRPRCRDLARDGRSRVPRPGRHREGSELFEVFGSSAPNSARRPDIADRYFGGVAAVAARGLTAAAKPPDALLDPLHHRVRLRQAGHRQPECAPRAAGDDGDPALRRVSRPHRPRVRGSAATPTTSGPR